MTGHFGPRRLADGRTRFSLWAPAAKRVELLLEEQRLAMRAEADGWFVVDAAATGGARYGFVVDGGKPLPDPASHFQPDDVHGLSELVDHEYRWRTTQWRGRPWHEAAICELHVGTFSETGTYAGVVDHLDALVDAGFTAIELMPVADFSGGRNWGYDGVLLFAPDSAYGRPEDLKALIDAAHERGLMVLLDVVYNHFGPDGNYLATYAPQFFTDEFSTPWGASIDYRREPVRRFAVDNALHWLATYRFDGLRLDAVHAIKARGQPSILEDIAAAAASLAQREDRAIHLVLENDDNAASLLQPIGPYRAQWNDDYHHAWHVLLTGETDGYYGDYLDPLSRLRRALSRGFVYQGEASDHRGGAPRGEPSGDLLPLAFVNFLQNHDQIGNRAYGERLEALAPAAAIEAALAVTLLAPPVPLMFMGEEWGSDRAFPFFCDFHGELAQAVEQGRRREFAAQYRRSRAHPPPSALARETFENARLDWASRASNKGRARLDLVRALLRARQEHVTPLLEGSVPLVAQAIDLPSPLLGVDWQFGTGARLSLRANLADAPVKAPQAIEAGLTLWGGAQEDRFPPWHVQWRLDRR